MKQASLGSDADGRQRPGTLPGLRGGLIGFGAVAEKGHLPEWLRTPGVEITSVAEPDETRRKAAREILPKARIFASADELFAEMKPATCRSVLDFVDICVPSSQHASFAKLALKSGCHVLCEKPLACRVEEVEELLALSAQSSLAVFTVHNWLHAPAIALVQELVSQGAIGPVHHCHWSTIRTQPAGTASASTGRDVAGSWRANSQEEGGGLLFDHGWHAFYVVTNWIGAHPQRTGTLLARTGTLPARTGTLPVSIAARLSFPQEDRVARETWDLQLAFSQAKAEIHLTWAGGKRENHAKLEGRDGMIQMLDDTVLLESCNVPTRAGNVPVCGGNTSKTFSIGSSVSNGSYHPDWFGGVIRDFRHALSDSEALRRNQEDALLCARLIDAARRSHENGGAFVAS